MSDIGFKVSEAKERFFDGALIERATDRAELNALFKSANTIKLTAQRSMRKARQRRISELTADELKYYRWQMSRYKKGERRTKPVRGWVASKPGEAPRRRIGYLREFLFSVFVPETHSAIAGPARLASKKRTAAGTVPGTLEKGGTGLIGTKKVTIAPRPYMRPALAIERDKAAKRWENTIKKG